MSWSPCPAKSDPLLNSALCNTAPGNAPAAAAAATAAGRRGRAKWPFAATSRGKRQRTRTGRGPGAAARYNSKKRTRTGRGRGRFSQVEALDAAVRRALRRVKLLHLHAPAAGAVLHCDDAVAQADHVEQPPPRHAALLWEYTNTLWEYI
eukprot:gene916-biopygen166